MRRASTAVAVTATLLAAGYMAASASAAVHLESGALYTSSPSCRPPGLPGVGCVFKFRAASDGRSLRFAGITAVDVWRCNGGGGEALLGGKKGEPIPLLKLVSGRLVGSVTFRSSSGKTAKITVSGRLGNAGKTAVITFHSSSGGISCATPPLTLQAH